jgi:hypothetical protein
MSTSTIFAPTGLQQHPLSAAFPAMAPEDFDALRDNVTELGVLNPITLHDGMVLDGWHRYLVSQELGSGYECPAVDLDAGIDPRYFVIGQNKARRHIAQGQLALAVAAVYKWKPAHRPNNSAPGADLSKTTAQMAEIAGVGTRTMEQAKAVEAKATPKVREAVKAGEISVKRGAEIAKLPAEEQAKALEAPKPEVEDIHYFGPSDEEIAAAQESAAADMSSLDALMAADDKLAAAVEEIKKLKLQLAAVESQRDGYMNRSNELTSRVNSLKKKLAKAEASNV